MNTIYEKIYVITTPKAIDKQLHIKSILDKLKLNFEFIYSVNTYKLRGLINYNNMNFNDNCPDNTIEYNYGHIGCTFTHYTAIENAYYHNFNNVLIFEDDARFIKNYDYIEYVLNNIPNDADIIRYGLTYRDHEFTNNDLYIKNDDIPTAGTQCYALCNKNTINNWLHTIERELTEVDNYKIWNIGNTYQLQQLICIDPNADIKNINKENYE